MKEWLSYSIDRIPAPVVGVMLGLAGAVPGIASENQALAIAGGLALGLGGGLTMLGIKDHFRAIENLGEGRVGKALEKIGESTAEIALAFGTFVAIATAAISGEVDVVGSLAVTAIGAVGGLALNVPEIFRLAQRPKF